MSGHIPPRRRGLERAILATAQRQVGWNAFVERFDARLRAVARAHRLAAHDVDDVIQTTWLRLLEHAGNLREPAAIGAWLETTAQSESLRVARGAQRERPTDQQLMTGEVTEGGAEHDAVLAEQRAALIAGLARLPARQRRLLLMLLADPPVSYAEISSSLDIPVGSIGPTRARSLARNAPRPGAGARADAEGKFLSGVVARLSLADLAMGSNRTSARRSGRATSHSKAHESHGPHDARMFPDVPRRTHSMRWIISAVAGLALVVQLAACGGGNSGDDDRAAKSPPAAPRAETKLSKSELIERTRSKVVKVFADSSLGPSSGTAVVLDAKRGILLTNGHVVEGAAKIIVKPSGGGERVPARVLAISQVPDMALLQMETVTDGLEAITFAESKDVAPGDTVLAMGFEGNVRRWGAAKARASFGFVDDTGIRNADLGLAVPRQPGLMMTSAAINPGSSGGPIVDEDGEVVALITYQGGGENQGYGIEADVVRKAIPRLRAGKNGTGLQTVPVRALDMADIIYTLYGDDGLSRAGARELGRIATRVGGLLVVGTTPGSSADHHRFELGDVIVTMNGLQVNDETKHARVVGSSSVIKTEGYSLGDGLDSAFDEFTRRVRVK